MHRVAHDRADLPEVVFIESAHRHGGRPDAESRGDGRRSFVERNGVAVDGDPDLGEALLGVLAAPLGPAKVDEQEMRVGPAGEHVEPATLQRGREHVGIRPHCALVVAERLGGGDLEARRFGSDHMVERPALHAGEHRAIDRLSVLLATQDEPRTRAGEGLVRGRRDEVAVLDRVRLQPRGDEPGEMSHVAEEQRADLVSDLAEAPGLDRARVRRTAADDQLRPMLLRE